MVGGKTDIRWRIAQSDFLAPFGGGTRRHDIVDLGGWETRSTSRAP